MIPPLVFTVRPPNLRALASTESARYRKLQAKAADFATDRSSREARTALAARMKSAGLGKLDRALGHTSSLRKRQQTNRPYGVIYVRGGSDSLAAGALEAYSQGALITARHGRWLAFQTPALQRRVRLGTSKGASRMTPQRYVAMGSPLGKLSFRPTGKGTALLVARNVTLHPRTGRAKAAGARAPRTRIPAKEVVVFVLIRYTRRAKRFDKDRTIEPFARKTGSYFGEALQQLLA